MRHRQSCFLNGPWSMIYECHSLTDLESKLAATDGYTVVLYYPFRYEHDRITIRSLASPTQMGIEFFTAFKNAFWREQSKRYNSPTYKRMHNKY